ncbi:formate transport [Fusarium subglutinans]|uniref:Formate transport n=1 Tax=Gibberella subglutinans TaxID=42677 RepID=A0A8H5PV51_GIBSU|nr:formate transport [Fusarium subglutinans]KAF5603821.1 formate transport [Fusarium subglutinans]
MSNPLVVSISNLAAYTPQETIELVSRSGVKRGNMRPDKVFLSAVSAGCLLGFGCGVSLCAMTAPWYTENAPGLVKLFGAGVFPLGLVLVVLTGADLFTATTMGRLPIRKMLLHWVLCFFGNLAGSLFVMSIIMGYGGVFDASPYREVVMSFASKKQISPQVHQIFLKAIGCNWLVCLAVFLGIQAKDLASKVIGMWWPIFAFVVLGLEHVVANMFYMSLAIWLKTPDLTVGLYIWKGMIPATIGNIIGGGMFVGVYYWYMYLFDEDPVKVDGVEYQGPHVDSHLHMHFLANRNKGNVTDEESRIESAHVSMPASVLAK